MFVIRIDRQAETLPICTDAIGIDLLPLRVVRSSIRCLVYIAVVVPHEDQVRVAGCYSDR